MYLAAAPLMAKLPPAGIANVPASFRIPPLQLRLVTVTVLVPPRLPPLKAREPTSAGPLNASVPPLTATGCTNLITPKLNEPPLTARLDDVKLVVPTVTAPLLTEIAPAPPTIAAGSKL